MENATKALLMAAGVLIGLMVISLGVSLYMSLSEYVESTQDEIAMTEIKEFNEQFTKYINCNADGSIEYTLTIQDIVTAANIAYENNQIYDLQEHKEGNYYVTVKLSDNELGEIELEKTITSTAATLLQNGLGKEYKCQSIDVKTSEITGRVYELKFSTLTY